MQLIPRLPASAVDYLAGFNVRAVAITPTGFVFSSANPSGAVKVWWCRHTDAVRLAKAAFASRRCRRCCQTITHSVDRARSRARAGTARGRSGLDEALLRAQDAGSAAVRFTSAVSRKRRLAARQTGQRAIMTYAQCATAAATRRSPRAIANGGETELLARQPRARDLKGSVSVCSVRTRYQRSIRAASMLRWAG